MAETSYCFYDAVPYRGPIVPLTSPAHLNLCSRWHGDVAPPLSKFHLTELGCGDAANLSALAFYNPESTFLGIDHSRAELDLAQHAATSIGLTNISFIQADVREIDGSNFASSDYIIAHGLYSWAPQDARDAILRFCRQNLAPTGLAYISYNAQPGWAMRHLVRETLLRSRSVRDAPLERKAQRAIEFAAQLLEDLPSRQYAAAVLLAKELERVRDGEPFYVLHEYLADVNEGFWLRDFVQRARSHDLEYITDAQFCRWEGRVAPELKSALGNRDLDPVEQEELADLLGDRYFRASILRRADAPNAPLSREELWQQVSVATSLSAKSDPFDLRLGIVETFLGAGGAEITVEAPTSKAAIVSLAAQWPRGMRLRQLHQHAAELLPAYGCEVPAGSESQLTSDLEALFEAGQIDLRLSEPGHALSIPEFPAVHALARFEASQRKLLTTPYHLPIPFEPEALALIGQMDGSRSLTQLRSEFGEKLVESTASVLVRWGLLR